MAQIIASGTTDQSSADIVVAAGAQATISLFWTTQPRSCNVKIDIKGSNGSYMEFQSMNQNSQPLVIDGPGTFRVRRLAAGEVPQDDTAFGVDQT